MNEDKKNDGLKFTSGSCLTGIALLVIAVTKLADGGNYFGTVEYEGLQGFGQMFLGVLAELFFAMLVFAAGSALYQYVIGEALNKWKITSSPLAKAIVIALLTAAILWVSK